MKNEDPRKKRRRIEKVREKHKDIDFKEKFSKSIKDALSNTKVRERMSKKAKQREASEEFRKRKRNIMKLKWKDPNSTFNSKKYRIKLSKSIKKSHSTDSFRENRRNMLKRLWKNSSYRNNFSKKIKLLWADSLSKYNSKERSFKISQYMKNGGAQKAIKGIKNPSKQEVALRKIVKILYPSSFYQYSILNYSVDIAICEYKIAIEYDGYYHFNNSNSIEYHNKRQKEIESHGWKFIRYNYFESFPTKDKVKKDIREVLDGSP